MSRRLAHAATRVRDQRGQTVVEWLGLMVVLTVLVLLVFAVKPTYGEQLRCAVGAQVDRILSIDQSGDCNIGKSKPDIARQRAILHRGSVRTAQDRLDRAALRATPR